jgi:hypothetical protein
MTIEFVKLPWFKGTPFYWRVTYYNNGNSYVGYRILCLGIRIYK